VEIDKDNRRFLAESFDFPVGGPEGAFQVLHVDPPFKIKHCHLDLAGGCENGAADSGSALGIVKRAQDPFVGQHQRHLLLFVPDVIAAGDAVHPHVEQFLGGFQGQAEAAGGVLAVGNHQINGVPVHQTVQFPGERLASRFADDVTYE